MTNRPKPKTPPHSPAPPESRASQTHPYVPHQAALPFSQTSQMPLHSSRSEPSRSIAFTLTPLRPSCQLRLLARLITPAFAAPYAGPDARPRPPIPATEAVITIDPRGFGLEAEVIDMAAEACLAARTQERRFTSRTRMKFAGVTSGRWRQTREFRQRWCPFVTPTFCARDSSIRKEDVESSVFLNRSSADGTD